MRSADPPSTAFWRLVSIVPPLHGGGQVDGSRTFDGSEAHDKSSLLSL